MMWGRSTDPCKQTALRLALFAFAGYLEGKERAYMVEAAISDIEAAFGKDILPAVHLAQLALAEEDEGIRLDLMRKALDGIKKRIGR